MLWSKTFTLWTGLIWGVDRIYFQRLCRPATSKPFGPVEFRNLFAGDCSLAWIFGKNNNGPNVPQNPFIGLSSAAPGDEGVP
jgi:hypothetical protein